MITIIIVAQNFVVLQLENQWRYKEKKDLPLRLRQIMTIMTINRTMPTFYNHKFNNKNFHSKLNSRNKFNSKHLNNKLSSLNFNNKLCSKNLNNKKEAKKLTKVRVEKYLPDYNKNPSNGNLVKNLTMQQTNNHHKRQQHQWNVICSKWNSRAGKRKWVNNVKQKRKLDVRGATEGDMQSAKGTKTLNPRAGKNTY